MAAGALNWAYPAAQVSRVLGLIRPAERVQPDARSLAGHRGTPEIYFAKVIDNSRLIKVADPARTHEMRMFTVACAVLFFMMMIYAWQHFSAVEYGYKIEQLRGQRDSLQEVNRELRLEEAALRDPERIDQLAHKLGLASPQVGQVARIDEPEPQPATAVLARANGPGAEPAAGER